MNKSGDQRRILAISILAFTGGLGGGVVFPILPVLGLQLGIAPLVVGLILSLNRIIRLLVNPLTGMLVDRFGARWPLIAGLLVEAIATLCFAAGTHSVHAAAWFLVGRALWGVGSSLLMISALAASLIYSGNGDRGMATAKVRMALSIGVPAGLVLGGIVSDQYSPESAFLTAAVITVLGTLIALRIAPERPEQPSTITEAVGATPSIRNLLRYGPLWTLWLLNFCIFFSVQGVILASLVLVLQERSLNVHLWGAQGTAGVLMAVMIGASALTALVVGKNIDHGPHKSLVLVAGSFLLTGGFLLLALAQCTMVAAVALALIGIGVGGINVPSLVIMGDWVSSAVYGRAVGIYQFLGDIGGSLGPIVGIEAIYRFGSADTLLAMTIFVVLSMPLTLSIHRHELCFAA